MKNLIEELRDLDEIAMVFGLVQIANAKEPETVFYIRVTDDDELLSKGTSLQVETRCSLVQSGDVAVIIVMFQINQVLLAETWMNFYADDDEKRTCIESLCVQNNVNICLVGDKSERLFSTENGLQMSMSNIKEICERAAPWTMAAFDNAKGYLQNKFGIVELWDFLNQ